VVAAKTPFSGRPRFRGFKKRVTDCGSSKRSNLIYWKEKEV
jgi:hypothetical protein